VVALWYPIGGSSQRLIAGTYDQQYLFTHDQIWSCKFINPSTTLLYFWDVTPYGLAEADLLQDWRSMSLRDIIKVLADCTASHLRRSFPSPHMDICWKAQHATNVGIFFFRGSTYYVRLGATRLDITEYESVDVTSRYINVHYDYSSSLLTNDIAVINLNQYVQFTCECSSYQTSINIVNMVIHFLILWFIKRKLLLFKKKIAKGML
jgi:hypothetical protein